MTELKIAHDDDIIKTDEGLVFNPYNPLNIKITLSEVQSILSRYGIPPNVDNMALYERAFVHRSYIKRPGFENIQQNITIVERPSDCMPLSSKSNERLEFLGDGVLECVTKYLLYRRFPKADEGFMTEKKIAIVKNEAIGKIALEMGLHKWLIISKHAEEKKIRTNLIQKEFKVTPHYLQIEYDDDLGYKMGVYLCLGQHIYNLTHNDAVDISFFKNFKAVHEFISENGKALIFMGLGQHKIKRKAEQIACNEAIQIIETHSSETN
jgi:dsRNA-specific ribonuclease